MMLVQIRAEIIVDVVSDLERAFLHLRCPKFRRAVLPRVILTRGTLHVDEHDLESRNAEIYQEQGLSVSKLREKARELQEEERKRVRETNNQAISCENDSSRSRIIYHSFSTRSCKYTPQGQLFNQTESSLFGLHIMPLAQKVLEELFNDPLEILRKNGGCC
ncbi:hypothetical protein J3R30DRAFT_1220837 [Lentinula aciculospora]|uniref:Uncharacterized protein n=1 Tax=Lentinula aciculospora TaxID=153920 RepID=A0A9W9DH72_9AGAR|nr:hypothetical protein J3R30DRAFT_1220837 [Lentinula aciculospora]